MEKIQELAKIIKETYSIDLTPKSGVLVNYKTVKDSIVAGLKGELPTFNQISKDKGEGFTTAIIELWLWDIQNALNLKNRMDEYQIIECASLLMQSPNYRRLNISDINRIFTKAKVGGYGEFYESINMAKVNSWFEEYFSERLKEGEMISTIESHSYKYNAPRNNKIESIRDQKAVVLNSKDLNQIKNKEK